MSRAIFKYPLSLTDTQRVTLPVGSQVLTVQSQGGSLQLWAIVPTNVTASEDVEVRVYGTGMPVDVAGFRYLTTIQQGGGALVWHFFVRGDY